jgi:hypothetical protein
MLCCTGQAAFAIIVNAGVDLLFAFNGGQAFVNHNSALHARNVVALTALPNPPLPTVKPDATVNFDDALLSDAVEKIGTAEQVKLEPASP